METKANSKNHHHNNSNIRLLISYNHMHLIVTYWMEIVFNTKSIRWKVLVTWVFLSGHMILRTSIPFSCFLSWWPWCWNLWEPGDDEAGQSSCVIDHWMVPGQRTESAHWDGAWCLIDEPASSQLWHHMTRPPAKAAGVWDRGMNLTQVGVFPEGKRVSEEEKRLDYKHYDWDHGYHSSSCWCTNTGLGTIYL